MSSSLPHSHGQGQNNGHGQGHGHGGLKKSMPMPTTVGGVTRDKLGFPHHATGGSSHELLMGSPSDQEVSSQCYDNKSDSNSSNSGSQESGLEMHQSSGSGAGAGVKKRGNWHNQIDFILSLVGYCVGLGNLWRFPFKCYKNGGGAFLIPYFFCLLVAGMPMYYMELSLGQFTSRGPLGSFQMAPLFKGIGYGMIVIVWLCCVYYNVVVCWIVYYLFNSLTFNLPWASCGNPWNSRNCSGIKYDCELNGGVMVGYDCYNSTEKPDLADNSSDVHVKWVTPSEEFWNNHVLNQTGDILDFGGFQWHLVISLLVSWVLVYFCLLKGIKSSGKVVWVTSTLPYVLLLVLLVQTIQLPGAMVGIKYYLTPQWEKLADPLVWGDAAQQIFYSLGLSFGTLMTMASYNRFNNNISRDAAIVSIVNCITSIFGGFVIFSVIGFMSVETGQPVSEVASEGAGLAFVVYPEAVVRLPGSSIWAVIFFLMLLSLGLDSQFSMFETVTTALFDKFPWTRSRKPLVVGVMCSLMFLIALPMVTQSGIYWLTLLDTYSAGFSLMFISLFETICIVYIYGVKRFCVDIETMTGSQPSSVTRLFWAFITPASMLAIFLFNMYSYAPITFQGYRFPVWADGLGWVISLASVSMVPLAALSELLNSHGSLTQRMGSCLRPSSKWGPAELKDRLLYEDVLKRSHITAFHTPKKAQAQAEQAQHTKVKTMPTPTADASCQIPGSQELQSVSHT